MDTEHGRALIRLYPVYGYLTGHSTYKAIPSIWILEGVMLAQLVKASVGQADVQRFELRLGHNWLSCGVFLVKSRHFGLRLAQTTMAKLAISLNGWLGRYTNVNYHKRGVFTKSIPEETRTITVPSLRGL